MELNLRMAELEQAKLFAIEDMEYGGAAGTADQTPLQDAVNHANEQVARLRNEARKRQEGTVPLCVRISGSQQPTPTTMSPI
ncbi:hypothetical protein BD324DRAFT_614189 [Kockovaella imperatae]|uniref:Uncharacterized protein n=1 Tax=Kockovaella imperatae TaxID=4999 RepID=A0A1Y1UNH9_9TREE|nr:hypothetical protein BD324DRAFT_614189 [Kockovaella imperatae]ORX39569.1 hypothetical protein BD324DRAFT_614189 [Kockovaella imperatae]